MEEHKRPRWIKHIWTILFVLSLIGVGIGRDVTTKRNVNLCNRYDVVSQRNPRNDSWNARWISCSSLTPWVYVFEEPTVGRERIPDTTKAKEEFCGKLQAIYENDSATDGYIESIVCKISYELPRLIFLKY